jgi:hypothetical protein
MAKDDFVDIVGSLTNFVQNERVAAYNEAVDDMLNSLREWVRLEGFPPSGDHLPDILNDFMKKWSQKSGA